MQLKQEKKELILTLIQKIGKIKANSPTLDLFGAGLSVAGMQVCHFGLVAGSVGRVRFRVFE